MANTKGLLNVAQHRFRLVPLVGKLTRRHRTLGSHRLEEGSVRESVLTRCLVALARPLVGRSGLTEEQIEGFKAGISALVPMRRIGRPEESSSMSMEGWRISSWVSRGADLCVSPGGPSRMASECLDEIDEHPWRR
jgi:hypothetical protein